MNKSIKESNYIIFKNFLYRAIRLSIFMLLSLSLFYSIQSETLYLDKLAYKFIVFLFCMLIATFIFLLLVNKTVLKEFFILFKRYEKRIFWSFFVLCIFYQIFLLVTLKATPNFDAGVLSTLIGDKKMIGDYLSMNSNNRLLYFINYLFIKIFGNSIIKLQIFNAVLIFLSALLLLKIAKKLFGTSVSYSSTFCFLVFSIIQPLYLVPYTDTYFLLPMFLSVYFLIDCYNQTRIISVFSSSLLSAFFFAITFLIRPSGIVFIFAIVILLVLNINKKKIRKIVLTTSPTFIIIFLTTLFLFNIFVDNQHIVEIDKSKEIPFTHFLLLGSYGDEDDRNSLHGTYNSQDRKLTTSGSTKSEQSALSINKFKERTKERGISRTIKFYWQKYINNTDSGVIGYHRDGLWLNSNYSPEGSFKNKIQQVYYEDGRLRPTFNFMCQLFWLFTLAACLVALYSNKSLKITLIALSLFGGLLFLELFESGGTKYLFQYVPLICLLAGVGIQIILDKFASPKSYKI